MFRLLLLIPTAALCGACSHSWDDCGDRYCLDVRPPQHAGGVGAAQGLDVRDDGIWIIGDSDTGSPACSSSIPAVRSSLEARRST